MFSTPGRFGKPIKGTRRFLKDLKLPVGTKCAVLTTETSPHPDKKTGKVPGDEEIGKCQHASPIMLGSLRDKDLAAIASMKVYVTGLKGPLETGWQGTVRSFTDNIINASYR